jgi:hypothetical protein
MKPNPKASVPHDLTHELVLALSASHSHSSPRPPCCRSSSTALHRTAAPRPPLPLYPPPLLLRCVAPPLPVHHLLRRPQAWVCGRRSPMFSSSFLLHHPRTRVSHLDPERGLDPKVGCVEELDPEATIGGDDEVDVHNQHSWRSRRW